MPEPRSELSRKAAQIFADVAFRTGQGMAGAMGTTKYTVNEDAVAYWLDFHADSIGKAVDETRVDWERMKGTARLMAKLLGATAARLALRDAGGDAEQTVTVTLEHVKSASQTVRQDARCQPSDMGGRGELCGG